MDLTTRSLRDEELGMRTFSGAGQPFIGAGSPASATLQIEFLITRIVTFRGSFSAGWTPPIARKEASFSAFRDLEK